MLTDDAVPQTTPPCTANQLYISARMCHLGKLFLFSAVKTHEILIKHLQCTQKALDIVDFPVGRHLQGLPVLILVLLKHAVAELPRP